MFARFGGNFTPDAGAKGNTSRLEHHQHRGIHALVQDLGDDEFDADRASQLCNHPPRVLHATRSQSGSLEYVSMLLLTDTVWTTLILTLALRPLSFVASLCRHFRCFTMPRVA